MLRQALYSEHHLLMINQYLYEHQKVFLHFLASDDLIGIMYQGSLSPVIMKLHVSCCSTSTFSCSYLQAYLQSYLTQ